MRVQLDTRTLLFGVFILGAIVSFVFFILTNDYSPRDVSLELQFVEIEARLDEAREIYRNCLSLSNAGVSAPTAVRSGCVESRGFLLWARQFPFDPKLSLVRSEFLTLAAVLEEVLDVIAIRPTSEDARTFLNRIPPSLTAIEREIANAKQWWRF